MNEQCSHTCRFQTLWARPSTCKTFHSLFKRPNVFLGLCWVRICLLHLCWYQLSGILCKIRNRYVKKYTWTPRGTNQSFADELIYWRDDWQDNLDWLQTFHLVRYLVHAKKMKWRFQNGSFKTFKQPQLDWICNICATQM